MKNPSTPTESLRWLDSLQGDPEKTKEWNEWVFLQSNQTRVELLAYPDTDLDDVILTGADLSGANLNGAKLRHANLNEATLWNANLTGVNLYGANLTGAELERANLTGAILEHANLNDAEFIVIELHNWERRWVPFLSARLAPAPFALDRCKVRRRNFWPTASDDWSILRRTYTGPMMIFVLIFTLFAFAPYGAKAMLWAAVGRTEQALSERGLLNDQLVERAPGDWKMEPTRVAWILLAPDQGWHLAILGVVLLAYSVARAYMTLWVGAMREAEERSQVSPAEKDYRLAWQVHRWLSLVGYVSLLAGAWRVYDILSQEVLLPTRGG